MEIKKIYAKNYFKVNRYNCYLYDKQLVRIKVELEKNNFEDLSSIIDLILCENNITKLSNYINLLVNYYPKNEIERKYLKDALDCISIKLKNKKIDIKRIILNLTYKSDLREISYYSDNNDLSREIVDLPFESALRVRK